MRLLLDGKELDSYQSFYQAKIKNNDMLLLKNSRTSTLQGPLAQRNVSSNYLSNPPVAAGRLPSSNHFGNQQGTSNQNYGSFAGYNQRGRNSSQPSNSNRSPNFNQGYPTNPNRGPSNAELPLSDYEIAMQKEIERKIHFDRMDKNL